MDFTKLNGLIPAVIQDDATGEVLMVGFMNEEALALTRSSGYATFFSRTRNTLWMKGETSGNRLKVVQMLTDCDDDTVLLKVFCEGNGVACHTGSRSCFRVVEIGPKPQAVRPPEEARCCSIPNSQFTIS